MPSASARSVSHRYARESTPLYTLRCILQPSHRPRWGRALRQRQRHDTTTTPAASGIDPNATGRPWHKEAHRDMHVGCADGPGSPVGGPSAHGSGSAGTSARCAGTSRETVLAVARLRLATLAIRLQANCSRPAQDLRPSRRPSRSRARPGLAPPPRSNG